jgi:hypothetical protein
MKHNIIWPFFGFLNGSRRELTSECYVVVGSAAAAKSHLARD